MSPALRGTLALLAGLALILGGQVSFVAGVLALWLYVWARMSCVSCNDGWGSALVAAAVVVAGEAVQVAALRPSMPAWWLVLGIVATVGSATGLGATGAALHRAGALTPTVPVSSHGVPLWFAAGTGVLVVAAMTVGTAHAEGSLVEGLIRGALEALAFAVGFLALGRFLGMRRLERGRRAALPAAAAAARRSRRGRPHPRGGEGIAVAESRERVRRRRSAAPAGRT